MNIFREEAANQKSCSKRSLKKKCDLCQNITASPGCALETQLYVSAITMCLGLGQQDKFSNTVCYTKHEITKIDIFSGLPSYKALHKNYLE